MRGEPHSPALSPMTCSPILPLSESRELVVLRNRTEPSSTTCYFTTDGANGACRRKDGAEMQVRGGEAVLNEDGGHHPCSLRPDPLPTPPKHTHRYTLTCARLVLSHSSHSLILSPALSPPLPLRSSSSAAHHTRPSHSLWPLTSR